VEELGRNLYVTILSCLGQSDEAKCREIVDGIVEKLQMQTDGIHASLYHFPAFEMGGEGYTYFQPIVTSFIAGDKWTFKNGDHGIHFIITSCIPYDVTDLLGIVEVHDLKLMDMNVVVNKMDNGIKKMVEEVW